MAVFSFVGGKGGVGKTTCAAIDALRTPVNRRRQSERRLLVTTDPASSLSAVLVDHVTGEPQPVRGAAGLYVANVDAERAFERWLSPRKAFLAEIAVRGTYLDEEDVGRLLKLSLPGIDEVVGLLEVVRLADGFDSVIVDTAPTGHTLRLLAAPKLLDAFAALLDTLQSHHRVVVGALRGSYSADATDAFIGDVHREAAALSSLLRDPGTTLSWVTLPEPMALEETADAIAALAGEGISVKRLTVNRVTGLPPQRCAWCEGRNRFEARSLAPVNARFDRLEIVRLPEIAGEPRGVTRLRALARLEERWTPPSAVPPVAHRVRGALSGKGDGPALGFSRTNDKIGAVLFDGARWLLFGGKGGVGKSTCAAAAALLCAETRRVLLVSTDPAHSLADVFGQRFDNTSRPVRSAANLFVREIDAPMEMRRLRGTYLDAVDEAFARIGRVAGSAGAAFRELIDLAPPGIDEVVAIAGVAGLVDGDSNVDLVVTDTAPTGHALRLLQTPAVLHDWTQALMALLLKYRAIVGAGSLAELLVRLSRQLRGLQAALRDPSRTRFIVVTRPAVLPAAESRTLIESLDGLGISVGGVIVNAVGRGTCRRCRAIARRQAAAIADLGKALRGYAIIEAPAEVPPPHGRRALGTWRTRWRQVRS